MYSSTFNTEEVNAKLIQWSLAKTSQIKEQVNTAISESCLIVAEWYLCSNRHVKQISDLLKTIVEQPNSVLY